MELELEASKRKIKELDEANSQQDCFFDSVAQGLNELKDKGLITSSKGFSVKSLRESCKQYAQKGSWLDNALKREGEKLCEYIQRIEFTSEDIESASSDSGIKTLKLENALDNALKGKGEKFCEYIPRIEFAGEDIENANPDSTIKILKLENAIWGRTEIEEKIISERYNVRIEVIELREKPIDGLHVTTGEEGTDIENSSHEQSDHSRSTGKENRETGRKHGRSVTDKDDRVSKKLCIDVNIIKDSEPPSNLQDEPRQNELHNARQTKQYIPCHLVGLMYQLDLLVLCSLRKFTYEHKYPSLSLAFGDSEIGKFNNIVLCNKKKSIHIQIENVDKYYIDNDIGYARLFTKEKEKRSFFINDYFDSFVKHLISKPNSLSNNIKYLVIYTNSSLDLTEEEKLKQGRSWSFYPFKFDGINMEECGILKDFLFTNDNTKGNGFYRFSQDKTTREELFKRLEFSSAIQKVIEERKFSQEVKENFLDKLVFAVNQPNREELNSIVKINQHDREELNSIIKNEIENKSNKVPYNYEELHEIVLRWSESHEFGPITKGIMKKFLGDIKSNRSSHQEIQNKNIEEIKFAKSVVGRKGTPTFNQFLDFLIKGEGIKYLEVLKGKGINLANMSSILNGAGNNAAKAFKDLYDLWFDAKGNKTQYLKTLEEGVNLPNMSSILYGAGNNAAKYFKDLYDVLFDAEGEKRIFKN
ncbi:uncharacterized protein TNCV_4163611 [Trichonephila clavipes]|nr:uncharacterized protein TNCV_4163611 [Trichonephila clavipes]